MKYIQYKLCMKSAPDAQEQMELEVKVPYSEDNIQRAIRNSADGTYSIVETADEPERLTLEERISALEKTVDAPQFTPGTWYYRGDKILFEGQQYTCIAPQGVVCVWSSVDHPQYWA